MDYEKEYKEALERATIAYKDEDRHQKATLERIFPVLAENEDEKIRQELISNFNALKNCHQPVKDSWLAWLERQVSPDMVADAYLRGCNDTEKKWLEKQGEQKPIEWSEKDDSHLLRIIWFLRQNYKSKSQYEEEICSHINWLESLKNKVLPQSKQEWSDEDYNEIETIACHLDNIDNEGMAKVLRNIRDKYYHIIPQNTWKPSDEQMEVLSIYADQNNTHGAVLTSLYQDLKKLRG